MQEHIWNAVEKLHLGESAQKAMTAFERGFISKLFKAGPGKPISSRQCGLVLQIEKDRSPNLGDVRLEYNRAVARLKKSRTAEDLRLHLGQAVLARCQLLQPLHDDQQAVVIHNLAESLAGALVKELPDV